MLSLIEVHWKNIKKKNLISQDLNVKNSIEVKERVESITLEDDDLLVSFDAKSLFTNIPVQHAIRIISNNWNNTQLFPKISSKKY